MLAVVVTATGIVSAGVFHPVHLTARLTAACLVAVLLLVFAGMLLVLVAAAWPAKAACVFVLVRHCSTPVTVSSTGQADRQFLAGDFWPVISGR